MTLLAADLHAQLLRSTACHAVDDFSILASTSVRM
jgi:hypothetical protein